jgi:N-acetyl-anhydromuramyl-L-alanine amidase AmpD
MIKLFLLLGFVVAGGFPAILNAQTIVPKWVDSGFYRSEKRTIDILVIHSTYNASGGDKYNMNAILKQFQRYRVAAHYLINRQGTIFQLVRDSDIAKHAGRSMLFDGSANINSRSIGIELMNDTTDTPTDLQYNALTELIAGLSARYPIRHLVRHSDIAPGRKTDPWNTDWEGIRKRLVVCGLTF